MITGISSGALCLLICCVLSLLASSAFQSFSSIANTGTIPFLGSGTSYCKRTLRAIPTSPLSILAHFYILKYIISFIKLYSNKFFPDSLCLSPGTVTAGVLHRESLDVMVHELTSGIHFPASSWLEKCYLYR